MTKRLLAAALAGILLAGPALAATGPWVDGDKARVRLVAARPAGGGLEAMVEVELAPGWKTYWRSPGVSGIAPVFDFSASTNVGDPSVAFPVPERHDDGYGISNVYAGRVAFPVAATTPAPGDPAELRLTLDIGVCEVVCIPAHFELSLAVAPGDEADAEAIAAARALLPGPAVAGRLGAAELVREGGTDKRPVFAVTLLLPDPAAAEVFVEGPADWYAGVPELVSSGEGRATYRVKFDRLGARTPIAGAPFRVTIVTPEGAIEDTITLDDGG